MESVLALISIVTGVGAGTLALVAARRQPDRARQLRGLAAMFFGIAVVMGLAFGL